jgi:hypothetical protein
MLLFGDDGEYIGEIGEGESVVEIGFTDVASEAVDAMEGTRGVKGHFVRPITVCGTCVVVSKLENSEEQVKREDHISGGTCETQGAGLLSSNDRSSANL